ncbi:hypothetical protein [Streptomyces sp. NBC_01262]|uniref:hypothetical protein n=1 Tax=Streptomyces sp. NBC_01262 TaxID=2903803 RepID=UPI002E350792|nr:hypothetical protein [Streptomyces sp. NBC_01262]
MSTHSCTESAWEILESYQPARVVAGKTIRHAEHMDIIRELSDGETGDHHWGRCSERRWWRYAMWAA